MSVPSSVLVEDMADIRWKFAKTGFLKNEPELVWEIPILEHSCGAARFTIRRDWKEGYYTVTWWHGNQGHHIGNGAGVDSAKAIAENHLRLIANGLIASLSVYRIAYAELAKRTPATVNGDSASVDLVPCPDGSRVLMVNESESTEESK